jgi:Uma2 family endonuclease
MALGTEWGKPLTVDDVWRIPDDGHRYELCDGVLLVSPAPRVLHQLASSRLFVPLFEAVQGTGLVALYAPVDWKIDEHNLFQPDIIVVATAVLGELRLEDAPPLLAVEVLSPSTRLVDQTLKRAKYEEAGVIHYWIVDPTRPSLTALELDAGGVYVERAAVEGDEVFETAHPVAIRIVPGELTL